MRRALLTIFILFGYVAMSSAQTVLPKPAIDSLVAPTLILGQGRYAQAAESFHLQSTQTLALEKKLGTQLMWQVAGLAEGLAAIAAEKNNDPIAYEYWANSVRYFLMSGSSWQQIQSQLHQEFEQSNSRLQVAISPGDAGVSVDNTWLELFSLVEVWQERLNYFYYRQPSADLAARVALSQQTSAEPADQSKGSQLRQYSPNSQLKLGEGFKNMQTFQPSVSTEPQARSVTPVSTKPKIEPQKTLVIETSPVVITSPIEDGRNFVEHDADDVPLESQVINQNEETEEASKFRANLDAQSSRGVTATQRRAFTPNSDN